MTLERHPRLGPVSGLILAGGASSRFGEPKALAVVRDHPLVSWVASALNLLCDELVVSIGVHSDAEGFRSTLPSARLVRDRVGNRGPIEGLRGGFEAARGEVVAVAPCDAPFLQAGLFRSLMQALGEHEAAVPRLQVFDPVRAVYRRDAVLRVLDADESIRSPSSLVDRLDAVFLEGPALLRADPELASFIDVNRREDLDLALHAAVGGFEANSPRLRIRGAQTPG